MDVHDTWAGRDLPVLDATVGLLEHSYMVTVTDIAAKTGFDPSVVAQALDALDPIYVDFRKTITGGDPRFWYVFKVTPEARRAVGQWPTAEALASRLAEELGAMAGREADGDNQGLLAYAARLIGDTLREATLRAAEAVLAPAFDGSPKPEFGQQLPLPEPEPEVEFESLVSLPELPELLRPAQPNGQDQDWAAEEAPQAEEAPPPVQAPALAQAEQAAPPVPAPPPVQAPPSEPRPAGPSEAEPTLFRPSIAAWPAVDADTTDTDSGATDTNPDVLQLRHDAV